MILGRRLPEGDPNAFEEDESKGDREGSGEGGSVGDR